MTLFPWLVSALALVGVVLNIKKRASCFAIWTITNIAWTVIDLRAGLEAQAALFAIYSGLSVYGLVEWTKTAKRPSSPA
jgi:nicotinamide riboside transporter PnuC